MAVVKAQPEDALALAGVAPVSRETMDRLRRFVALLDTWRKAENLLSDHTMEDVWERHVADSAQLLALAPGAVRWVDLGSGAGFPGMILAILLAGVHGSSVDLVESNQRKCAFLRAAARETGAVATVRCGRIETILPDWSAPVDAVSARALAPLDVLCGLLAPLLARGIPAFLHKGAAFGAELTEASHHWTLDLVEHQSRIGSGVIVELRGATPRG